MPAYPVPRGKNQDFLPRRTDQRFPPRFNRKALEQQSDLPGLTIIDLLKKIGKTQLQNSKYVRIKKVEFNKTRNLYKFTTETYDPVKKETRIHVQRIYPRNPYYTGKLSEARDGVKITCNCGFHLFYSEVALFNHAASDIIYSNGDYPIDTNPNLKPWGCKHCFKDLLFLVQKGL